MGFLIPTGLLILLVMNVFKAHGLRSMGLLF